MQQPHLVISNLDLDRIEQLLGNHPQHLALQEELNRAEIRDPADMPPDVVTMNSTVRFKMQNSGNDFCLTLVYPKDAGGRVEDLRAGAGRQRPAGIEGG